MLLKIVLSILSVLSFQMLLSQANAYRFKHFGTEDGLSNQKVNCIIEDQMGFIWLGTNDGLDRFDGYDFETFLHHPEDTSSLTSNQISALYVDSRGHLWVGTPNGLNRFDRIRSLFESIPLEIDQGVYSQVHIRDIKGNDIGQIWIATNEGVFVLKEDGSVVGYYMQDPEDKNSLSEKIAGSILFDKQGQVWVGTERNINRLRGDQKSFDHFPLVRKFNIISGPPVHSIFQDSKNRIWASSNASGLNLFNEDKQQFEYFPLKKIPEEDLLLHRIRAIHEDTDQRLWLGTYNGIIIFDPENTSEFKIQHDPNNEYSLSHDAVNRIYEDRRGNIWIGAFFGGVNYLDKNINAIKHYQYTGDNRGPSFNVVASIIEDKEGKIWIAVEREGLNCFDPKTGVFEYFKQGPDGFNNAANNHIKEMTLGRRNNLWLGTLYGGLFSFDLQSHQFSEIELNPEEEKNKGIFRIRCLQEDVSGNLWIGSNFGIHCYQIENKRLKLHPQSDVNLPSGVNATTIMEDQANNIWIGTIEEVGLYQFNVSLNASRSYAIPNVTCLNQKDSCKYWVGTRARGLYSLNVETGEIDRYDPPGISDGEVFGILSDEAGNLWLSTNKGIWKYNWITNDLKLFDEDDGIQGQPFKRNAFLASESSDFYLGNNKGLCVFDPHNLGDANFFPPIIITNVTSISSKRGNNLDKTDPKKMVSDGSLDLSWDQNNLFIDFVAINFSRPEKTQYAYRLDGFDDWNYIGAQRNATYTNLDPGHYIFKVKATNGDGDWVPASMDMDITIVSPPWKTNWAYLLYALIIIGMSWLLRNFIRNRIRLKNKLKLEYFKRKQLQDFHELKYQFYTNISHDLKTPLTLILGPLEKLKTYYHNDVQIRRLLATAFKNGERLLTLINQLMDFQKLETNHIHLRAAKGNFHQFCYEIFLSFQEESKLRKIDYRFDSSDEDIPLYFDRDKIEKLLYNLLSNAFKFTRNGGIIEIVLNKIENVDQLFSEGHVELQVIDSGIGMTSKKLKTIFDPYRDEATRTYNKELSSSIGLSIVKSMTDLHRGKIDVHSEYGKGTRFVVRLPLGHLHLKNGEIIEDFKNSDAPVHYQVGTSGEAHPGYLPGHDSVAKSKTQARLLIVEDSMDIQQYMVDIFESQYDLLLAANGNDGFTQAIKYNPDLIISDIMMPEMNGIELCSRLKQELKTSHIPIILLSARTSLIFKVNGLETGADDYVSKPFSPQLLELKVKNLLRSREILRERFRKEATFNLSSIAVTSADERFLEHLIQLVQENMKNPEFGINFLSSELNITRVQLYRKIKALTNMTATEFVRQIRLIKAARLLTTTFLNINEVSYEIGFQDPSYFRKCFKQMYGHNPSKYRTN